MTLFGSALAPHGHPPHQQSAWYRKPAATFSDILALVRRHLWGNFVFPSVSLKPQCGFIASGDTRTVSSCGLLLTNNVQSGADAEFVYHMEDVLDVYTRSYDPAHPLVCMDEINTQLLADTRDPLAMEPGKTGCEDYEYELHGVCKVFLACEPLVGKRVTMTATQRTKREWAEFVRQLAEEHYPAADKIVLVLDNLNTHTLAGLYEIFPVAQASRLCQRFEVNYTPKHRSWLNMAEIELSALDRQCLSQRLVSFEVAEQQVAAWTAKRNQQQTTIQWRFTTEDASIKLKHLYPSIKD